MQLSEPGASVYFPEGHTWQTPALRKYPSPPRQCHRLPITANQGKASTSEAKQGHLGIAVSFDDS